MLRFPDIKPVPQVRDFILYLSGSLIVALVAIIRLPVLTSYFTPAEFGFFSLVSITYTYLSIALYNWISSCLYRFYNEYRDSGKLAELYVNAIFLFGMASIILFGLTALWYGMSSATGVRGLILPAFGSLVTTQALSMALVIYKLKGRALQYNLLQAVQAVAAFLLILLSITGNHANIRVLFTAQAGVNLLLLGVIFTGRARGLRLLHLRTISQLLLGKLLRYGSVGFASAVGVYILISSDRYIISLYGDISSVGIYNQVYQIGQVSVYFLVTVYFNTITPGFNRLLTGYTADREKQLTAYVQIFLLLAVPVTFYVALFAREVSGFLLGEAFRQGYRMIPWIVTGTFFYGLTLFNETRMKFRSRFRPVLWGIFLACIVNAALNFLLIPRLGYTMAAISTFVAYVLLFLFYYIADRFFFFTDLGVRRALAWIAIILGTQGVADLFIRYVLGLHPDKWATLVEGGIFLITYAVAVIRLKLVAALPAGE